MIYFIQSGDSVKIGRTSKMVENRLVAFQIGNPVKLSVLCQIESDMIEPNSTDEYVEGWLHNRFSKDHIHGEWFMYSDEIKEFVESIEYQHNFNESINIISGYLKRHPEILAQNPKVEILNLLFNDHEKLL